jgi:hypothetical protein
MLCPNDEFIFSGVGREDGTLPGDREFIGVELFGVGTAVAEVEIDLRIDALEALLLVTPRIAGLVVFGAKAALGAPHRSWAEAADEIGHCVLILADREPRQLDAGRLVADAGFRRVKRVVEVLCNLGRVFGRRFVIQVVRHRFVDQPSKLRDRFVAFERVGVVFFRSLAGLTVATGALLFEDFLAIRGCGRCA